MKKFEIREMDNGSANTKCGNDPLSLPDAKGFKGNFYARYGFTILMVFAFLLPLAAGGARKAIKSNRNEVEQWLPDSYAETKTYNEFRKRFQNEQFILASWDGCTLDDKRLPLLARKLLPPPGVEQTYGPEPLFNSVITGATAVEEMTHPPLKLPREEAIRRLAGSLVGHDGKTTCMILTLTPYAKENLRSTVKTLFRIAEEECAIPPKTLHLGGPPIDNYSIDITGEQSLVRLAGLSALIGLVISWWCLKSPRLIAMVLASGVYSVLAAMAIVWYTGGDVNAILLTMPSLVYVATVSGAIHLANYYRDTIVEDGLVGAPGRALRHALLPLTLAAITTAVGLATLNMSDLVPIKNFGLYSAVGVLVSLFFLFLFLPACLEVWPLRNEAKSATNPNPVSRETKMSRWWAGVGRKIAYHHVLSCGACLLVMAVCGYGITKIKTSVQLMGLFSPGARILEDYAWLEKNVGELVPMEVVLEVDSNKSSLSFLERLELVQRIHERIVKIDHVGSALSAITFAPALDRGNVSASRNPFSAFASRTIGRLAFSKQLEKHRDDFLKGDYLRVEDGIELWRITPRVAALSNVDYGVFIKDIESQVEPLVQAYRDRDNISKRLHEISKRLHEQQKSLSGARIFFLGVANPDKPTEPDESILLVMDVLRQAGARVSYHDPRLPSLAKAKYRRLRRLKSVESDSLEATLESQYLVVVLPENKPTFSELLADAPQQKLFDLGQNKGAGPVGIDNPSGISVATSFGSLPSSASGIGAVYTGLVPLVYKAQHSLLNGMIWGFIIDMAVVAIVMVIVVKNLTAGVILLISAAFPAVVVFGLMGWFGIKVDTGTVMTPAVALGVTVDDVVHFMIWFQRGQRQGKSRPQSVMLAYKGCAQAMYQSWGVIGVGLSVFAVSPFTPTQRFGVLMLTMLTAALVGNMVLLPALLSGPLGALLGRRHVRELERSKGQNPEIDSEGMAVGSMATQKIAGPHSTPKLQTQRHTL